MACRQCACPYRYARSFTAYKPSSPDLYLSPLAQNLLFLLFLLTRAQQGFHPPLLTHSPYPLLFPLLFCPRQARLATSSPLFPCSQ